MMALIGSGPGGAGQTRMDPSQADTMLAEGPRSPRAGSARPG